MNKQTQKRNAAFKAAGKAERAIMVAKDALKMLNAGKIRAELGVWVDLTTGVPHAEQDLQICDISDEFKECSVCVLGSLMLSEIRHTNKLKLSDAGYQIDYMEYGYRLDKAFSMKQQKLIELAFEGGNGWFDINSLEGDKIKKVNDFYAKYQDEEGRLRAILKNIIKNGGKFVI